MSKPKAGQPESPPGPAGAPGEAERERVERDLDEMLAETRRERDEYLELAQRTKADFENYRKRVSSETAEAEKRGKAELARELIPVVDNLERALAAAGIDPKAIDGHGASDGDVPEPGDPLARGVSLVYRDLSATLARAGVEAYDPTGEKFDPAWHEAMTTRAQPGTEPGTVLEVLERGYRLDGQVLRAARVVVSE
jgi:molecular chaperone GrpE